MGGDGSGGGGDGQESLEESDGLPYSSAGEKELSPTYLTTYLIYKFLHWKSRAQRFNLTPECFNADEILGKSKKKM